MSEFTFSLDQLKSSAQSVGAKIDSSLYSGTRNEDLTYSGSDTIVWDRVNGERQRRGLSTLTALGFPRPPEEPEDAGAAPNPDGTANTFTVKGPLGLTREQAFEIFKKQASAGGLVGFKPGETLSAATQAADGLASAQAMLTQAQAAVPNLGSLTNSLASLGKAGGTLSGSLAQAVPGLTAAVGPAVTALSKTVSSGRASVESAVSQLTSAAKSGNPLVGPSVLQGSVAVTSIQTINKAITQLPVTAPINNADFTKVAAAINSVGAVSPIGPLSVPEVNGVLAQAKNLVGQASNALSNSKGLGSFGLNISQLETAGYVKPGTKALLQAGSNLFADVAKSPAIWTGKDGIKSATDLLKNPAKQSLIQQDLMTKGVAGLASVGVPVKNLSSQGLAGMALNAAKDLPSAEAFAKNLPIPGDATGAIQAEFSKAVRDGAFAVNLVNTKMPAVFKQEETPVPAAETVSRATVDAASSRVIGNDKVPPPNYGPRTEVENQADVEAYVEKSATLLNQYINVAGRAYEGISSKLSALENQQSVSQQAYDALNNEYQTAKENYNAKAPALGSEVISIYNRLLPSQKKVVDGFPNSPVKMSSLISYLLEQSKSIRERLAQLALKIEGRGSEA